MFTVQLKNRQFGYLSHYGRFANLADAQAAVINVRRSSKLANVDFTAVPTPDGVSPKPLHASFAPTNTASAGIRIDITDVVGPNMGDCRNIGTVPAALDGRDLHFSIVPGGRVIVRDYQTDDVIVIGRGWSATMQKLANYYGTPVRVACDPGVSGGASGRMVGLWNPSQRA